MQSIEHGVHRKKVDSDWRRMKVDQNKRGKISKPIWGGDSAAVEKW